MYIQKDYLFCLQFVKEEKYCWEYFSGVTQEKRLSI